MSYLGLAFMAILELERKVEKHFVMKLSSKPLNSHVPQSIITNNNIETKMANIKHEK